MMGVVEIVPVLMYSIGHDLAVGLLACLFVPASLVHRFFFSFWFS